MKQNASVPITSADLSSLPITIDIPESDGDESDMSPLARIAREMDRMEAEWEHNPDYAEQKARGFTRRGGAQSGSRFREGSLSKCRPVGPKATQAHDSEETLVESSGDTKFTPEEWARTFKAQSFMPPGADS